MIYAVAGRLISLEVFFFLYLVAGKQIHLEEWWGEVALYAKRIKAKWGVYYSNLADNPLAKDPWPLTKQIKICHCHQDKVDKSTLLMFSDTHKCVHTKTHTHWVMPSWVYYIKPHVWLASCTYKHTQTHIQSCAKVRTHSFNSIV